VRRWGLSPHSATVEDFLELEYLQAVIELHLVGRWAALGGALTGIYLNQGVLRLVLFASKANLCS
jgi:hypothetical protein